MMEKQIIETGIVPVYMTDTGEKVVDGRELWTVMNSKQEFSNWIKRRFDECEALENKDFSSFDKKIEREKGATIRTEYLIKLSTAKEMAMLERNAIGKQVRKYFIMVEEKYSKQLIDVSKLSPEMQMFKYTFDVLARMQIEQSEMQKQLAATTEKVEHVENTLSIVKDAIIQRDDDWRRWLNKMFNAAVEASDSKDFQAFRHESYVILEERGHCNLNSRLRNLQERLAKQGATKTAIKSVTRIDVIENDPRLKEIYTAIVKEYSIRYIA